MSMTDTQDAQDALENLVSQQETSFENTTPQHAPNDYEALKDIDIELLLLLTDGRINPKHAVNEIDRDISRSHITNSLRRLVEHGVVTKLSLGLYDLNDNPNGETPVANAARRFLQG